MSEANTPGKYYAYSITTDKLTQLLQHFSRLSPGVKHGVSTSRSTELWVYRAQYCLGYAVSQADGTVVGIAAVFRDLGQDPHFTYKSVAQVDFTAIDPGHPGATCALYQHIKSDLRRRGAEAMLITRMVSDTEFRSRVYRL